MVGRGISLQGRLLLGGTGGSNPLPSTSESISPVDNILDQIKPGGRIVLPLGLDEAQRLTVVDKGADGQTSVRQLIPVRFSRLETVV